MGFRFRVRPLVGTAVHEITAHWPASDIYFLCSGNFTVEKIAEKHGRFQLHSNEVTLYSCAVGAFAAGTPLRLGLREEARPRFDWLLPYMETPEDALATVVLLYQYGMTLWRADVRSSYARMAEGVKQQWPTIHPKSRDKVLASLPKLASFRAVDAFDYLDDIPADAPIITYPPFRGAETVFADASKFLEKIVDWDAPQYELMGDERFYEFIRRVTTDDRRWILGSNEEQPIPGLEDKVYMYHKVTNRSPMIRVYTNDPPPRHRVVMPHQQLVPLQAPRLVPGVEIGNRLALAPIQQGQFDLLRSEYLNKAIAPAAVAQALLVTVDGMAIGAFAASPSDILHEDIGRGLVYMMSDFAVSPTDYPRLSKLVLYAVLSKEARLLYERLTKFRVTDIVTTAFTDNAVSMKYRGLFHLRKRVEAAKKPNLHGKIPSHTYELTYAAPAGQWTLEEGLALWKKKHGQRSKAA